MAVVHPGQKSRSRKQGFVEGPLHSHLLESSFSGVGQPNCDHSHCRRNGKVYNGLRFRSEKRGPGWNHWNQRRVVMRRAKLLAGTLVGTALLGLAFVGFVMAETPSHSTPSALTGKVTSQAEGAMEGVLVGAKKVGSTVTTWVVSNAQGQYSFPPDRMEPGKYAIKVRAAGYELPNTSVDVTAQSTQLDLQLNKVTSASKLVMQLSNGELL